MFMLLSVLVACGPTVQVVRDPVLMDSGALDTGTEPLCGDDTGAPVDTGVPVAACATVDPTVAAALEGTALSASGSYDPSGCPLAAYTWTVASAPAGSQASVSDDRFAPDLVGAYELELVVTDGDGQASAPCVTEVEAVPAGFQVEVFWTAAGDDLDLHLVKHGGGGLESYQDCHYRNCTGGLDWGVMGEATDDAMLMLDDVTGTGPEVAYVEAPATGEYTVYVHDYAGSVYEGPNPTTVNIYANGTAWSATIDVDEEDAYVPFATISFPSGVVTPL